MTAWLDFAPTAFDRKARPAGSVALFGRDEALTLGDLAGALFTPDGDPVPEAAAPLSPREREALEAERAALLARVSDIDAMLNP